MTSSQWIGRRIVSRYGLVADVIATPNDTTLTCRAFHNGRIWSWPADECYLVTYRDQILCLANREVIGFMTGNDYQLYPENQRHTLTHEEAQEACQ